MFLRITCSHPYESLFQEHFHQDVSYEEALRHFQESGFLIPGHWTQIMRSLGAPAMDIVSDFAPLQEKWKSAYGCSQESIFLSQIAHYKPEVIYFERGAFTSISPDLRKSLKKKFPFIRLVTGLWGDELPGGWTFGDFSDLDFVFATYHHLVEQFRKCGIKAYLLHLCFDHCMQVQPKLTSIPFLFCGSTGWGTQDHLGRYFDLLELLKRTDLKLFAHEPNFIKAPWKVIIKKIIQAGLVVCPSKFANSVRAQALRRGGRLAWILAKEEGVFDWGSYPSLTSQFPSKTHSPVFGIEYLQLLQSAYVVFNKHRDEKVEYANIRMFEVTGVGSCLLTDRGEECASLFASDEEIVTFKTVEEAIEKYTYLTSHENERKKIALAGQRRTLKDHTLLNHCKMILETIAHDFTYPCSPSL